MDWVLDIGHTHYRLGYFAEGTLCAKQETTDVHKVVSELQSRALQGGMISNVRKALPAPLAEMVQASKDVYVLNTKMPLPIAIGYRSLSTLGSDRLAAVVGAWQQFPNEAVLVISMGSCITYTFYTPAEGLIGGGISPGIAMRARALGHFTDMLPEVQPNYQDPPLIGTSTLKAIQSGIWHGAQFEVAATIEHYIKKYGAARCILCGGGAKSLVIRKKALKKCIFIQEDIILLGLYAILIHVRTR